jgi:hemoglobin
LSQPSPETTPYQLIGGEQRVRELVDRFYDYMDVLPEAYAIRKLHPQDLQNSRGKFFMFLSGWMGGPQLYIEQFGHPRLRARHFPFAIDSSARDQWLMCMEKALDDMSITGPLRQHLDQAFSQLADHMRNKADE